MADSKLMNLNPHVAGKLAKQVMEDMRQAAPGRRLPPPHVGASPLHKDGLLTNGHVVHGEILFSITKKRFAQDLSRVFMSRKAMGVSKGSIEGFYRRVLSRNFVWVYFL